MKKFMIFLVLLRPLGAEPQVILSEQKNTYIFTPTPEVKKIKVLTPLDPNLFIFQKDKLILTWPNYLQVYPGILLLINDKVLLYYPEKWLINKPGEGYGQTKTYAEKN